MTWHSLALLAAIPALAIEKEYKAILAGRHPFCALGRLTCSKGENPHSR